MLALASLTKLSLRRERCLRWEDIMHRVWHVDGRLADLSYHAVLSEGLVVPAHLVWDQIDGLRGLCAIVANTGVMIDILYFLQRNGSLRDCPQDIPDALRGQAVKVRILAVIGMFGSISRLVRFRNASKPAELACMTIARAAESYVSTRVRLYSLMAKTSPDLCADFAYHFSLREAVSPWQASQPRCRGAANFLRDTETTAVQSPHITHRTPRSTAPTSRGSACEPLATDYREAHAAPTRHT
jgi:hypothetical protein